MIVWVYTNHAATESLLTRLDVNTITAWRWQR